MENSKSSVTAAPTFPLIFRLIIQYLFLGVIVSAVVFIFQRENIVSGEYLGLPRFFLIFGSGSLALSLLFTMRGLGYNTIKTITRDGKKLTLYYRFSKRSTEMDCRGITIEARGRVRLLGRKIVISKGPEKWVLTQSGFAYAEWEKTEKIFHTIIAEQRIAAEEDQPLV